MFCFLLKILLQNPDTISIATVHSFAMPTRKDLHFGKWIFFDSYKKTAVSMSMRQTPKPRPSWKCLGKNTAQATDVRTLARDWVYSLTMLSSFLMMKATDIPLAQVSTTQPTSIRITVSLCSAENTMYIPCIPSSHVTISMIITCTNIKCKEGGLVR